MHLGLRCPTEPYLCLWNDGAILGRGSEEGGKWCGHDERAGSNEATQVAAGDVIFLFLHNQRVHYIEDIPRDPYCTELRQKRCPLEAQCQWCSTIGQNVKPTNMKQECTYKFQYFFVKKFTEIHIHVKRKKTVILSSLGMRNMQLMYCGGDRVSNWDELDMRADG